MDWSILDSKFGHWVDGGGWVGVDWFEDEYFI